MGAAHRAARRSWHDRVVPELRRRGLRVPTLPATPRLLGSSAKVVKGERVRVLSAVVYQAPSTAAGVGNACPGSSAACARWCLGEHSGRMPQDAQRNSRLWKTYLRLFARDAYDALLDHDIRAHARKADRLGLRAAVRLDGSTDYGDARVVAPRHPTVLFWDYTKVLGRMRQWLNGGAASNWHLTFSDSGENAAAVAEVLAAGGGVATVYALRKGEPLPQQDDGWPVIDADRHDARFHDRHEEAPKVGGYLAGLRFKVAAAWKAAAANAAAAGFAR